MPVRIVDTQGNVTDPIPSYGPGADLSLAAQADRESRRTTRLPESFTFSTRTLPPDFFTALNDSPFRVRPSAVATGSAIARDVISALLYYAQFFCNPKTRAHVLDNLRVNGKYDGDLLAELMKLIGETGGRGGMRGYDGWPTHGPDGWPTYGPKETMWPAGTYYTADGTGSLTARALQATRQMQ